MAPPEDTRILSPVRSISVDFVSDIYDQAVGPILIDLEKTLKARIVIVTVMENIKNCLHVLTVIK